MNDRTTEAAPMDRNARYAELHLLNAQVQNLSMEIQRLMLERTRQPSYKDPETDCLIKQLQKKRDAAEWEVAYHWRSFLRDAP